MVTRVVTKVGDVFQTPEGRVLQLVAIDPVQMNSDVVVVYEPDSQNLNLDRLSESPVDFYHHTTVSVGVREGLWGKIGKSSLPDLSKLRFKQYFDQEMVDILVDALGSRRAGRTQPYWATWTPLDDEWKLIDEAEGKKLSAEEGGITPPKWIDHRIKHGELEYAPDWPTS